MCVQVLISRVAGNPLLTPNAWYPTHKYLGLTQPETPDQTDHAGQQGDCAGPQSLVCNPVTSEETSNTTP